MTPLQRIMTAQGMTVMTLSRKTGLKCKYLYALASGERTHPSWPFVAKIAKALNVDPTVIFPPYGRR